MSYNRKAVHVLLSIVANIISAILLTSCTVGQDTHEKLHAVLWTQTSAEYVWAAESAYARASTLLDAALSDSRWTAAVEQEADYSAKPPAVVMDIDETVLDNSAFQGQLILNRSDYDKALWASWVKQQRAGAVPGAVNFINYALGKGVRVFFITNRHWTEEDDTRANLKKLGITLDETTDIVLSTGENAWTSDKTERREFIASRYRILLLFGDDLRDFLRAEDLLPNQRVQLIFKYRAFWDKKWILLPNPIYGGWEAAILRNVKKNHGEILKIKRDSLCGMQADTIPEKCNFPKE